MDDSAARLILSIARRPALALVSSLMCAVAVISAGAVAVAAPPLASAAVVASAAAGQDASAVESSLGFDRSHAPCTATGEPPVGEGMISSESRMRENPHVRFDKRRLETEPR